MPGIFFSSGGGSGGGSPAVHASSHEPGGTDPMAVDASAGTASLRTLGSSATQAAAGTDTRFPAGDLIVNADVDPAAAIAESKLNLASDAAAGTASRRTLGTGATQAAAGDDNRFPAGADIVNADIGSSAAIAYSKLATLSTGQVLLGNAGVPTATTLGGDATVGATGTLTIANDAINAAKIAAAAVGISEMGVQPSCRVTNSTALTITNNTTTVLTFDTERWDTDTIHDTGTNPGRLTATTAGKYFVTAHVQWVHDADGSRLLQIRKNGATLLAATRNTPLSDATALRQSVATVVDLAATDYVEAIVLHTAGNDLDVSLASQYSPEFAMARVSA